MKLANIAAMTNTKSQFAIKTLSTASPLVSGDHQKSGKYFFESTKTAIAQITDLYDFIWPSLTALWNLRWQVTGYLAMRGEEVSKEELDAKFTSNENSNRPNLYRAFVDFSWDKQKRDFSKIILTNLFALFESWVENILRELNVYTKTRADELQFPSLQGKRGILEAINDLTASPNQDIVDVFYVMYIKHRKYSGNKLNALLIAYRYFKECRNAIIHSGGVAGQRLVKASAHYHGLSVQDLGMNSKPAYSVCQLGDDIDIDFRGVIGFSEVIDRIITTVDAELIKSNKAKDVFVKRIRKFVGTTPKGIDKLQEGRKKAIRSIISQSAFIFHENVMKLESLMTAEGLIK